MPFLVHFPPSNNPPPSPKGTRAGLLKGGRLIPLEFDTFSCWLPIFDRLKRKSSSLQEQGITEQLQQSWRYLHFPVPDSGLQHPNWTFVVS